MDSSNIIRNDELYNLLIKASKKYDICILANNYLYHFEKVY